MMLSLLAVIALQDKTSVQIIDAPMAGPNGFYIGNRAPLRPSEFIKLPIGSIEAKGWIKGQLIREANGFVGHLTEMSAYLQKSNNAWLRADGLGENGWEEVPYWLKGFGDLGYVLGNSRIQAETKVWIEGVLASQREDGWFGPRSNLKGNSGHPDVWPNMVMLCALQSWYDFHPDPRVIEFMRRYFRWELAQPDSTFLLSYWEVHRGGDNLASVYWLYNRTGDPWLLDLARKLHRRTANWVGGVPDWHGVNFAQAFREPAEYSLLSNRKSDLAATETDYETMRHKFGQVPGGMYGADENARPGYSDPRQAAETCAMVEMMFSDELLLEGTGNPAWAERCEDVAFNSFPASMTADEKALHYLTAPNMPLIDGRSKSPGLQNSGPMLLFNPNDHRCCQHNVAQGWPYYAESLWFATGNNGLGVALYAPSSVTAKVGYGQRVSVEEKTVYPFRDLVHFIVHTERSVRFPLTLRLPTWCQNPSLRINGKSLPISHRGAYAVVNRDWRNGDRLDLQFPMQVEYKTWADNQRSVSVNRGPLTYSLKISEKYQRDGGTSKWPAYDVLPNSAWNYGLIADQPVAVSETVIPTDNQPFDSSTVPVHLTVSARKIANWTLDSRGLVETLQESPAFSSSPIERVELVPMGAVRLRVSAFPTVSSVPSANRWVKRRIPRPAFPTSSSHTFASDTTDALSDGILPRGGSGDESIPRFTWWDRKGTSEWVEYDFTRPKKITSCEVYWFDDRQIGGGCRNPSRWHLLYWQDNSWKPVVPKSDYGTYRDRFNRVDLSVKILKLRLVADLQPGYSGGILEWKVQ